MRNNGMDVPEFWIICNSTTTSVITDSCVETEG